MTDCAAGRVEAAKGGWIGAVGGVIRRVRAGRWRGVQRVPDELLEDVGLMREERVREWWEYR